MLRLQHDKYFVAITTEKIQPLLYENGTMYYNNSKEMFLDYLIPYDKTHLGFLGLFDIEEIYEVIELDNPFDAYNYVLSLMAIQGIDNVRDNFMYSSYIMTDKEKIQLETEIYLTLKRVYDCNNFDQCCQMYRNSLVEYKV